MYPFVNSKQPQITKYSITYFALKVTLLLSDVVIEVKGELVSFLKIVPAYIANV